MNIKESTRNDGLVMEKKEMIKIASYAIMKDMDYETLCYSDILYGREKFADDIWDYVVECKEIGTTAFKEKYSDIDLYSI